MNWDEAERKVKVYTLVILPIILGFGAWFIQDGIATTATNQQYVNLAITILSKDNEQAPLRDYAVDLLKKTSPIDIDKTLEEYLRSGDLVLPKALSDFDEKAFSLLTLEFENQLENQFWPPIERKYNEYKSKEASAKKLLESDPNNIRLLKEYREYGILAEYLIREAYANESQLRKESLDKYIQSRRSLEKIILAEQGEEVIKNTLDDIENGFVPIEQVKPRGSETRSRN